MHRACAQLKILERFSGGAEARFCAWRSSSARAGADQTLQFVLSWYETIKLDKVRALREDFEWSSDPARIAEREETADFMAAYADTSFLHPRRVYSDVEEEEEGQEAQEEEGSSDSAAADDDSGEDDEEDDGEEVAAPEAPALANASACARQSPLEPT